MYDILFIHSLVEGHLCCFQVLAITNNAAMNIVVQMSFRCPCSMIEHSLGICPRVVVLLGPEVG